LSFEGQSQGTVLYVENGEVVSILSSDGDIKKFVNDNSYPIVGQLTTEN